MGLKDANGMANSVDPDQTDLDLHCCSNLFVPIIRIFIVYSVFLSTRKGLTLPSV